jgi:hypothetical protein
MLIMLLAIYLLILNFLNPIFNIDIIIKINYNDSMSHDMLSLFF